MALGKYLLSLRTQTSTNSHHFLSTDDVDGTEPHTYVIFNLHTAHHAEKNKAQGRGAIQVKSDWTGIGLLIIWLKSRSQATSL